MSKVVKITKKLPVALTPAEKNERADKMAKALEDAEKLKAQKKRQDEGLNEDIKEKNGIVRNLARIIASGKEDRDVKCEERWNYATRRISTVRLDTDEIVDERTMSDGDRQESLIKEPLPKAGAEEKTQKSKGGDPLAEMEGAVPKKEAKKGDPLAGMENSKPKKEAKKGDPLAGMETDESRAG